MLIARVGSTVEPVRKWLMKGIVMRLAHLTTRTCVDRPRGLRVPLDHNRPNDQRLTVFYREVHPQTEAADLPWLLFLQRRRGSMRHWPI